MLRDEPIIIDDSDYGRDYTYVLDTAAAVAAVVDAPAWPHDLYNVTNATPVTRRRDSAHAGRTFPANQTGISRNIQ